MRLERIGSVVWLLNLSVLLSCSTGEGADNSQQARPVLREQATGKSLIRSYAVNKTEIERYFDAVVARTCLNEALGCVLVHLAHIKNTQQSLTQWVY